MDSLVVIILLLAPIVWGAICAAIVWAFLSILRPVARSPMWFVSAGVIGLVASEFEMVRILVAWGYDGQCSANASIMEKVPKFRPSSSSEWRSEQ